MDSPAQTDTFTWSHAGSCPKCSYVFPPIWEAAPTYFSQGYVECSQCQAKADLWDVVSQRTLGQAPTANALVHIGATSTHFNREFTANKYHEIDLTAFGITKDATVLQVGYTPQGGSNGVVFPIELHGNVPQRQITDNVLRLLGTPATSGDGTVGSVCPVAIWVVWVRHEGEDGWPYIIGAFDAFIRGHYDRVIVPAQSAVEITLMPVIGKLLERHSSTSHVKGFMGDRLTFGNVINVLLPFVCGQAGLPKLPEKVRVSLNKLRKFRNAVVHSGTGGNRITSEQAVEGLCASVFGFEYARYARPKLTAWLK